jgi:hypothetical protein
VTPTTTVGGSKHLVDLPGPQAAQVFAFQEPFFAAGVFSEVELAPASARTARFVAIRN